MSKHVLILGAGRTGALAAEEFAERGAEISVYNRTAQRAYELAKTVGGRAVRIDTLPAIDAIIDCTDAGAGADIGANTTTAEGLAQLNAQRLQRNVEQKTVMYGEVRRQGISAPVFIYTNPPDTIASYVSMILDSRYVYGVGLELDVTRARRVVAESHGTDIAERIRAVGVHNKPILLGNDFGIEFDQQAIQKGVLLQLKETLGDEETYACIQRAAISDLADFVLQKRETFHLTGAGRYSTLIGMPVRWVEDEIKPQSVALTTTEAALLHDQVMEVSRNFAPLRKTQVDEEIARADAFELANGKEIARWLAPELELATEWFRTPLPESGIRIGRAPWLEE